MSGSIVTLTGRVVNLVENGDTVSFLLRHEEVIIQVQTNKETAEALSEGDTVTVGGTLESYIHRRCASHHAVLRATVIY